MSTFISVGSFQNEALLSFCSPDGVEYKEELDEDATERQNSSHDDSGEWLGVERLLRDLARDLIGPHGMFDTLEDSKREREIETKHTSCSLNAAARCGFMATLNIRVCVRCTLPVNRVDTPSCASLLCCAVSTLLTGSVHSCIRETSELEVRFCSCRSLICFGPLYSKNSEVGGETSKSVGPIGGLSVSGSQLLTEDFPSVRTHTRWFARCNWWFTNVSHRWAKRFWTG